LLYALYENDYILSF